MREIIYIGSWLINAEWVTKVMNGILKGVSSSIVTTKNIFKDTKIKKS